jgi:hypothetical protein
MRSPAVNRDNSLGAKGSFLSRPFLFSHAYIRQRGLQLQSISALAGILSWHILAFSRHIFSANIPSSICFLGKIHHEHNGGKPRSGQGPWSGTLLPLWLKDISNNYTKLLPRYDKPWYRVPHLLKLNLLIGCALQFSSATGYDGSMMNGVLSLSDWHTFMDNPTGAWLGFIAAAAALGQIFG